MSNLILTRRFGEAVIISVNGVEIGRVTIVGASSQVKLGFDFPSQYQVDRAEIATEKDVKKRKLEKPTLTRKKYY